MRRNGMLKLATTALAVMALAPTAASAAPALDGIFDLRDGERVRRMALGPDGNVWATLTGIRDEVARIGPDGSVAKFDLPGIVNPWGITTGPDGKLWITSFDKITRFDAADPSGTFTSFTAADLDLAMAIVTGPDGNLWTAYGRNAFKVSTGGVVTSIPVTGMTAARDGIAAGSDGKLYIADNGTQSVISLTTGGVVTIFPAGGIVSDVAAGPAGQVVFTSVGAANALDDKIGRLNTADGAIRPTSIPYTEPQGITFADDGAYWSVNKQSDSLTRMTPDGATTTLRGLPAGSGADAISRGPNGTLWVGLPRTGQIARVTGVTAPPRADPRPVPDTTAPTVSGLVVPKRLVVGRAGSVRVTLDEAATVTLRFARKSAGRRKGTRCVTPRQSPRGKRCTRYVSAGSRTSQAIAGANRLTIGRGLRAGAYRLTITLTDAAGNRTTRTATLQVTPKPRRA